MSYYPPQSWPARRQETRENNHWFAGQGNRSVKKHDFNSVWYPERKPQTDTSPASWLPAEYIPEPTARPAWDSAYKIMADTFRLVLACCKDDLDRQIVCLSYGGEFSPRNCHWGDPVPQQVVADTLGKSRQYVNSRLRAIEQNYKHLRNA